MTNAKPIYCEDDPRELYELLQQIGSGSYGTVHQAFSNATSEIVAAKIMAIQDDEEFTNVLKEVTFLKKLSEHQHPNIVNYIESYYSKQLKELWIVMEFCGAGSITDLMRDANRVLDEGECAYVIRSLLEGLSYLKQQKILHRDVKGGNLLVTEEGLVKVSDFGVSSQLHNTFSKRSTFIGTPYWIAPEVFAHSEYNFAADIWSAGITVIELLEGRPPYSNLHPMRAMMVIPNSPPPSLKGQKSHLTNIPYSDELVDFLDKCLQKDPEKRPTAEELLRHPFMAKCSCLDNLIAHRYTGTVLPADPEPDQGARPAEGKKPQGAQPGEQAEGSDEYESATVVRKPKIEVKEEVEEEPDYGTVVRKPAPQEPEPEPDYGTVVRKPAAKEEPKPESQSVIQIKAQPESNSQKAPAAQKEAVEEEAEEPEEETGAQKRACKGM